MDFEKIIQRAFWLKHQQKKIIVDATAHPKIRHFLKNDQIKLLGLICSIPYAEKKNQFHGKPFLTAVENTLERMHLKKFFCRSLGTWNFHICHAQKFGYTPRKFKEILQSDHLAIEFVIDLLVKDIGLSKPPDHIFAEYNHNIMATTVAAMQRALNILLKKHGFSMYLVEDGLIGEQTLKALKLCEKLINTSMSLNTFTEEEIHNFLDQIAEKEGLRVHPFIPPVQIKMDFSFVKKVLHQSLHRPSQLKKLCLVFNNHINVPLYVNFGMQAYEHLFKKLN
jgi:hypothetical protein